MKHYWNDFVRREIGARHRFSIVEMLKEMMFGCPMEADFAPQYHLVHAI
jgi:hypothetical protein